LKDGSEKGLVADAKAGDRKAFDQLVRMYKDKMFALIYRTTNDREAALDLLQETFFAAFKELRKFRYEAAFSSWLYRIAANKSANYLRRKKLIPFFSLSATANGYVEPAYEMSDNTSLDELNRGVVEAVASLPPKQRAVL